MVNVKGVDGQRQDVSGTLGLAYDRDGHATVGDEWTFGVCVKNY